MGESRPTKSFRWALKAWVMFILHFRAIESVLFELVICIPTWLRIDKDSANYLASMYHLQCHPRTAELRLDGSGVFYAVRRNGVHKG